MKFALYTVLLLFVSVLLTNCDNQTNNPSPTNSGNKITYAQVSPILNAKCVSCHSGFSNYNGARTSASTILQRIQLQPAQSGFMPQGGSRLPDSEIQTIQKWIADGLLEK